MADSKNARKNISDETSMDEMIAWHRLEIKQIQNKVSQMKKAAAKGSEAEQEAKTKQVEEDIPKLLAKLKEKLFKEFDSKCYNNNSSNNNFKDEAKEESLSSDGECTEGRMKPTLKDQEEEINPQRQARLKQKMEMTMKKMKSSEFYKTFIKQLKSPEVSGHFHRILGSETQLQMVIYGIGSIESNEPPRFQLSIAVLMKREFGWVGNIEVYDPELSVTESSVIRSLGCTVLSVNEEARRDAFKPTIFFMPHCPADLYNNLLEANWRVDRLSKIALLGNSFQMYREKKLTHDDQYMIQATKRIKAARRITTEFAIKIVSYEYSCFAFSGLSWHFFS